MKHRFALFVNSLLHAHWLNLTVCVCVERKRYELNLTVCVCVERKRYELNLTLCVCVERKRYELDFPLALFWNFHNSYPVSFIEKNCKALLNVFRCMKSGL